MEVTNRGKMAKIAIIVAICAVMYLVELYNNNLFNFTAEFFSISIAVVLFVMAWNIRNIMDDSFPLIISVGYLFVASVDFLRTVQLRGFILFDYSGSGIAMNLWILARMIEASAVLVAVAHLGRNTKHHIGYTVGGFFIGTIICLMGIFRMDILPAGLVSVVSSSSFMIAVHVMVIGLLAAALVALHLNKSISQKSTPLNLIKSSVLITILSYTSFAFLGSISIGFSVFGYFLRIVALYLIYVAVYNYSLVKPFNSMLNNMKDSKERFDSFYQKIPENIRRYKTIFNSSPIPMWEQDFSKVKVYLEELKETKAKNPEKYLKRCKGKLRECIKLIEVIDVNEATLKTYKAGSKKEFINFYFDDAVESTDAVLNFFLKEIAAVDAGSTSFKMETVSRTLEGDQINIQLSWVVLPGYEKDMSRVLVSILDLTDIKKAEKEILLKEKQYHTLFDNSLDGIYRSTIEGKYIDVNKAMVKMLGYRTKRELLSINTKDLYLNPDDRPESGKRLKPFEVQLKKKNGSSLWVEISSRVVHNDSKPAYYEGIVRDIAERKEAEKEINYLSFHDKLTGLYSRGYFEEELKRLDTPRQYPLSLVLFDINGLKIMNDTFGTQYGDKLIRKIAEICRGFFRKDDICTRWGGDEFGVLMPKTGKIDTETIIERLDTELKKQSTSTMPLSVSFGYSIKTEDDETEGSLIKAAEEKMYKHKLVMEQSTRSNIISSLKTALEERDYETLEHTNRLVDLCIMIGRALGLSESKLDELVLLANLHDIGKIAIPDSIVLKPGKLTAEEFDIIKNHSKIGYRIAKSSNELHPIAEAILHHHERWDGNGYPEKIAGDKIPVISRILSVVDAYDAMTNDRPYRKALDKQIAVDELKNNAGSQFDPLMVETFLRVIQA